MDNLKIIDTICNTIANAINEKAKNLKYDKTFPSVIREIGKNGKYKIQKDAGIYEIPNITGVSLSLGQKVWVKIPCNDLGGMHICGLR